MMLWGRGSPGLRLVSREPRTRLSLTGILGPSMWRALLIWGVSIGHAG